MYRVLIAPDSSTLQSNNSINDIDLFFWTDLFHMQRFMPYNVVQ